MKGYRIVFPQPKKVGIEEFDVHAPGKEDVLVETEVTLISTGTELTAFTGDFPKPSTWADYIRYPFTPGYSNIGRVVEVGEDVEGLNPGDRVASLLPHATHGVVKARDLVLVPRNVAPEHAAFHTIACIVINSIRHARIDLGESVVVVGLGPLGQLTVLFSRMSGAYPVVGVDLAEERLELALKSGATHVVRGGDWGKVSEEVRHVTQGRMADVVFEVTGNPEVIPGAIRLARELGRFIVLSSPRGPSTLDFHDEVNRPSRTIIGTHASSQPPFETPLHPWTRRRNAELFLNFLSDGVVNIGHLITHRFHWREAANAYDMLFKSRHKTLGVVLDFRH